MSYEGNNFFRVINNKGHEEGKCVYFLIYQNFSNFLDDVSFLTDGPIKFLGIKVKQTYHTEVFFKHLNSSPI